MIIGDIKSKGSRMIEKLTICMENIIEEICLSADVEWGTE